MSKMKEKLIGLYCLLPWTPKVRAKLMDSTHWLQVDQLTLVVAVDMPRESEISLRLNDATLEFSEISSPASPPPAKPGNVVFICETSFSLKDKDAQLELRVLPPGYRFSLPALKTTVAEIKPAHLKLPLFHNVDGILQTDEPASSLLYGWCFAMQPLSIKKIQARLDHRPLNVEFPLERSDVAAAYSREPDAAKCGFECELPLGKQEGILTLEYSLDGNSWNELHQASLSSFTVSKTKPTVVKTPEVSTSAVQKLYNIDTVFVEQQKKLKTKVVGWLFLKKGPQVTGVRILYRDVILKCRYGLQREDVHQEFPGQSNALNCGFEVKVEDIPGNPPMVFQFRTQDGDWIEFDRRKVSQIKTTYYTDKKISEKKSGVRANVESAVIGRRYGHQFMFVGWCFRLDGKRVERVRVRTQKQIFEGKAGIKRKDVFSENRDSYPHSLRSGFEIPLDDIPRAAKLKFEYLDPFGRWRLFALEDFSRFPVSHFASQSEEKRDYQKWLKKHNLQLRIHPEDAPGVLNSFTNRPLISILMPVYNTPDIYLREAIQSVLDQQYPHWELCIADDASTEPSVWPTLEEFSAKEDRIKIIRREINGHICRASNSALALATGCWCAFLDHDDRLPPDALLRAVQFINRHPNAGLFYSDEDKLDVLGKRFDPYFKPDWNPELLEGQNFLCHLTVTRMSLVRQAGGFEPGLEGSQDWDLFLKITEMLEPDQIIHIPYTLYHWRAIEGSTALALEEKGYIRDSSLKTLQGHCARSRENVEILPIAHGHWRLKYKVPKPVPSVTLLIPTRDQGRILRSCIDSIQNNTTYTNFQFLIVNNQSQEEETLTLFSDLKDRGIEVVDFDEPFNFSALNNFAASQAESEFLAFLNNDITVINGDWLEEMISHARKPHVGAVGAKLYYPEDCIQHAGVILGINGIAGHCFKYAVRGEPGQRNRLNLVQQFSAVTAACLVVRKSIFEEVGGFEEEHLGVAFNDIDLCLRIREAGYKNIWTPYAQLYHHESLSRGDDNNQDRKQRVDREIEYMLHRWGDRLKFDPTYNPNLTLEYEDFSLAWPPRLPSP